MNISGLILKWKAKGCDVESREQHSLMGLKGSQRLQKITNAKPNENKPSYRASVPTYSKKYPLREEGLPEDFRKIKVHQTVQKRFLTLVENLETRTTEQRKKQHEKEFQQGLSPQGTVKTDRVLILGWTTDSTMRTNSEIMGPDSFKSVAKNFQKKGVNVKSLGDLAQKFSRSWKCWRQGT